MLRVVDYKRKFRVELSEHIRAVLAIHRKQYFAVRAADKGIFFAQLLAHALKAVYLAVADAVAAVKLERLHSRRIKTHYCETVKAEQTVSGVYYARVVRTARYRFIKARLKIGKGDAACTVAHYRTHISTSSCTIIQHSIGQVLYLAVPPIFFLSPTAASCLIGCRCNGRFPTHLLGSVLAQPFYRCVNTMMLFGLQLARCYSHILRRMALTVPCSLWVSICVTSPRSGAFDILFINACRH